MAGEALEVDIVPGWDDRGIDVGRGAQLRCVIAYTEAIGVVDATSSVLQGSQSVSDCDTIIFLPRNHPMLGKRVGSEIRETARLTSRSRESKLCRRMEWTGLRIKLERRTSSLPLYTCCRSASTCGQFSSDVGSSAWQLERNGACSPKIDTYSTSLCDVWRTRRSVNDCFVVCARNSELMKRGVEGERRKAERKRSGLFMSRAQVAMGRHI